MQRSPTDCGVTEYDREELETVAPWEKIEDVFIDSFSSFCFCIRIQIF